MSLEEGLLQRIVERSGIGQGSRAVRERDRGETAEHLRRRGLADSQRCAEDAAPFERERVVAPHQLRPAARQQRAEKADRFRDAEIRSGIVGAAQIEQEPDIDMGLVRAGLQLFEKLPGNATRTALLATDLHAGNVIRAEREPWLVIDPKPFVGDPAYDATQHLLNCRTRLRLHPDKTIRNFADLAEIEYERVRLWTFARAAAEPRDDWSNDNLMSLARAIAP